MEPAPPPSAPAAGPGAGFTLPARLRAAQPWAPALATGGRPAGPRDPARPRVPPAAAGDAWARTPRGRRQRSPTGTREAQGGEPTRAGLAAPQPRSPAATRAGTESAGAAAAEVAECAPPLAPAAAAVAPLRQPRRVPATASGSRQRPALQDGLPLLGSPAAAHRAEHPAPARPAADPPGLSTVAKDERVGAVCFSRRLGVTA